MQYTVSNDKIIFVSDSFNVEPRILRFNNDTNNYIWQDRAGEKPVTAICFPLLGSLPDNTYTLEGKQYTMGMHGFAQTYDFTIAEKTVSSIVYEITDDEKTYSQYPYRFHFRVGYSLEDSTLKVEYRVKNLDKREMYFSVGGHPRFACPVRSGTEDVCFEDYFIEFEKPEKTANIVKSYGPLSVIERFLSPDGKRLRLDYHIFEKGCFCFSPLNSEFFTLKNTKNTRTLLFRAETMTHFQLWTMPGAPYIALEPWYGSISPLPPKLEDRNWIERTGTLHIPPEEEFVCAYYLTIHI